MFHWVRCSKIQNWGYFFYLSDNLVEGYSKQWWSRPWRTSPTSFPRRSPLVSAALGPFHFSISFVTTERRALFIGLDWLLGHKGWILWIDFAGFEPSLQNEKHWPRFTRNDLVILKLAKSLQSWSGYPSGCSWTELAPFTTVVDLGWHDNQRLLRKARRANPHRALPWQKQATRGAQ